MFGNDFFTDLHQPQDSKPAEASVKRPKSPPRSFEEWLQLEDVDQWPSTTPGEAETSLDPDDVLGSLDDIRADLQTHSPWDARFLDGIGRRLEVLETTLLALADRFSYGSTAPESVAGGLANIRDMTFLTEVCDTDLLSSRRLGKKHSSKDSTEGRALESLVYPGIGVGRNIVPFPGTLEPLHLLDLVTKSISLPSYIIKGWRKIFYSEESCSLLQNTFWYVWLSYFKTKPDPEGLSRLFTAISENFVGLLHIMDQKRKDEVFVHYPGCLAQAVYSAFCHGFPKSNTIFNSDNFLTYLTDLTSEWIAGVVSPPDSWKKWPRHTLNPHHTESTAAVTASDSTQTAFSEKDVMKLSVQGKSRPGRPHITLPLTAARKRGTHTALNRAKIAKNTKKVAKDEGACIGTGPTFESVWFSLAGRSPLLQHYLVTHGLEEAREGGVEGAAGPVVGRTQIKQLPEPTVTYRQLLQSSKTAAKQNYNAFEKDLAKKEQEIIATRKKHNALLRAADRRNERLMKHRHEIAIMAERIMNKYTCRAAQLMPAQRKSKRSPLPDSSPT